MDGVRVRRVETDEPLIRIGKDKTWTLPAWASLFAVFLK